jgi:mannose-6-phosphate isomerase-like protein (cupin superfamily)
MRRTITGFRQDDEGDWVAELSCLHGQHVRHQPPFQDRAWTTTAEGRASRIGAELECPLCDRAELPDGLTVARTARFDDRSLPAGLRRDHRVAERTWAVLRVQSGRARFTMAVAPPIDRVLGAGDAQAIPPGVPHAVVPDGSVELTVDFLVRSAP